MLLDIPLDVLRLILFHWLESWDRIALRFVCKHFRRSEMLKEDTGKVYFMGASRWAAEQGYLRQLMWMTSRFGSVEELARNPYALTKWTRCLYQDAARGGQIEVLKWTRANRWLNDRDHDVCEIAAKAGHLDVLKWLFQAGFRFDSDICAAAADANHFDVVKWFILYKCGWDSRVINAAAKWGNLEMIKWGQGRGCVLGEEAVDCAAERGDLVMLEYFLDVCAPFGSFTLFRAARGGHLKAIEWLIEKKNPPQGGGPAIVSGAISGGHIEILEWALAKGFFRPVPVYVTWESNGIFVRLPVLKWLHAHGCRLDSDLYVHAIKRGELETLKWLKENNVMLGNMYLLSEATPWAAPAGLIEWMKENDIVV